MSIVSDEKFPVSPELYAEQLDTLVEQHQGQLQIIVYNHLNTAEELSWLHEQAVTHCEPIYLPTVLQDNSSAVQASFERTNSMVATAINTTADALESVLLPDDEALLANARVLIENMGINSTELKNFLGLIPRPSSQAAIRTILDKDKYALDPTFAGHDPENVSHQSVRVALSVAQDADSLDSILNYAKNHGVDDDALRVVNVLFENQSARNAASVTLDKIRFVQLLRRARSFGIDSKIIKRVIGDIPSEHTQDAFRKFLALKELDVKAVLAGMDLPEQDAGSLSVKRAVIASVGIFATATLLVSGAIFTAKAFGFLGSAAPTMIDNHLYPVGGEWEIAALAVSDAGDYGVQDYDAADILVESIHDPNIRRLASQAVQMAEGATLARFAFSGPNSLAAPKLSEITDPKIHAETVRALDDGAADRAALFATYGDFASAEKLLQRVRNPQLAAQVSLTIRQQRAGKTVAALNTWGDINKTTVDLWQAMDKNASVRALQIYRHTKASKAASDAAASR